MNLLEIRSGSMLLDEPVSWDGSGSWYCLDRLIERARQCNGNLWSTANLLVCVKTQLAHCMRMFACVAGTRPVLIFERRRGYVGWMAAETGDDVLLWALIAERKIPIEEVQ